jgi:hypothetical protein
MGGFVNPNNNMKQPPIPFNQNNVTRNFTNLFRNYRKRTKVCRLNEKSIIKNQERTFKNIRKDSNLRYSKIFNPI